MQDESPKRPQTRSVMDAWRALKSGVGMAKWIAEFKGYYFLCRLNAGKLPALKQAVMAHFDNPWVAGVDVQLRPYGGTDFTVKYSVYWDAPVAVSVARKTKRGERLALCMSCYLIGDTISIRQLQGVFALDIPPDMRNWPEMFCEACRTFAMKENLRHVRIARAQSLYSFRKPEIKAEDPVEVEAIKARLRERMIGHYNETARKLGFVERGGWFEWSNPNFDRQRSAQAEWSGSLAAMTQVRPQQDAKDR